MKAAPQIIIMGAKAPPWVLSGAAVDMDFANGRYYGDVLANLLSISRASQGTDLLPTSASGAAYNTFANNVLRITPGVGLLIEEARTNVLLNSTAPATQTSASLATGTYTLWCNGSGSVTPSGGTATITGAAAASQGAPNTFTVTVAGTVVFTVSGSLNAFQCELGAFGTSLIVTGGTTATRAADNVAAVPGSLLQTTLDGGNGYISSAFNMVGNSTNNRIMNSSRGGLRIVTAGAAAQFSRNGFASNVVSGNAYSYGTRGTSSASWGTNLAVSLNRATVVTGAETDGSAGAISIGSTGGSAYLDGYLIRLAVGGAQPSNAALQALTV